MQSHTNPSSTSNSRFVRSSFRARVPTQKHTSPTHPPTHPLYAFFMASATRLKAFLIAVAGTPPNATVAPISQKERRGEMNE